MNHYWFIFKEPQTIITNEFNKKGLKHKVNEKNDELKEL